jgi:hypothetical protein
VSQVTGGTAEAEGGFFSRKNELRHVHVAFFLWHRMGIVGLETFLRLNYDGVPLDLNAEASRRSTPLRILVDGNSLVYQLFMDNQLLSSDTDVPRFLTAIDAFVAPFRHIGVELVCVFDGCRETCKADTHMARRRDKLATFGHVIRQVVRILISRYFF